MGDRGALSREILAGSESLEPRMIAFLRDLIRKEGSSGSEKPAADRLMEEMQ